MNMQQQGFAGKTGTSKQKKKPQLNKLHSFRARFLLYKQIMYFLLLIPSWLVSIYWFRGLPHWSRGFCLHHCKPPSFRPCRPPPPHIGSRSPLFLGFFVLVFSTFTGLTFPFFPPPRLTHSLHSHACLSSREWLHTSARWVSHVLICMVLTCPAKKNTAQKNTCNIRLTPVGYNCSHKGSELPGMKIARFYWI